MIVVLVLVSAAIATAIFVVCSALECVLRNRRRWYNDDH